MHLNNLAERVLKFEIFEMLSGMCAKWMSKSTPQSKIAAHAVRSARELLFLIGSIANDAQPDWSKRDNEANQFP